MNAKRTLAAAAVIIAASAGAACSGSSPTMAGAGELDQPEITMPGGATPTDTTGFIPAQP